MNLSLGAASFLMITSVVLGFQEDRFLKALGDVELDFNCLMNCSISRTSDDCFQLTDDLPMQVGVVWSVTPVKISDSFVAEFDLYFGTRDGVVGSSANPGADGIAFVLQNQGPHTLGRVGGGLGFSGIAPSLGVEFDTYQNGGSSGDPPGDHIALIRDGKLNLGRLNDPIELSFNLEDGQFHPVKFEWIAHNQTIRVSLDGTVQLTKSSVDLASLLGHSGFAYLGFTASTGHASNRQQVCIKSVKGTIYEDNSANPSSTSLGSEIPSRAPSIDQAPTALPSRSPSISHYPSIRSSKSPTDSHAPTNFDSSLPSTSTEPSSVPSSFPSGSTSPSMSPSIIQVPSLLLPTLKSRGPTVSPVLSTSPSTLMIETPSSSPDYSPTKITSVSTSLLPSTLPSMFPSILVSESPSLPSLLPSIFVSGSPSLSTDAPSSAVSPDFTCVGSCEVVPSEGNCFQLTNAGKRLIGAVWANRTLDVQKSFTVDAALYFGTNDAAMNEPGVKDFGADGIAFVLQNEGPDVLGGQGGGIGFAGIAPSIAVKFDTYQNKPSSGDPSGDHIGLIRDGRLISGRLSPSIPLGYNLEDGQFHNFTFEWNSVNQTMSVNVDGALILTNSSMELKSFFNQKSFAFPGFTASTGESTNRHVVCIKSISGHFKNYVPPQPRASQRPVVNHGPSSEAPTYSPSTTMISNGPDTLQTRSPSGASSGLHPSVTPVLQLKSISPAPSQSPVAKTASPVSISAMPVANLPPITSSKVPTPAFIDSDPAVNTDVSNDEDSEHHEDEQEADEDNDFGDDEDENDNDAVGSPADSTGGDNRDDALELGSSQAAMIAPFKILFLVMTAVNGLWIFGVF